MRYKRTLFALFFGVAASFISSAAAQSQPDLPKNQADIQLFLLAGQSNMAGRGKLDAEAAKPYPRVLSLNQEGNWQPAVDPVHWDKQGAGVGIGRAFGKIVVEKNPGITVGLIPTACGGSPIISWAPGRFHDQTKSKPYDDAMARTKRALQDGTLKAILWHQGESDVTPKDSVVYEQRLEELITRFRSDLGNPDLPVIIGQLGRFPAKPWTEGHETVDKAQQAVAKKMKNVAFVTSEGLTSHDNLHFDTKSARELGRRYAEAYFALVKQ